MYIYHSFTLSFLHILFWEIPSVNNLEIFLDVSFCSLCFDDCTADRISGYRDPGVRSWPVPHVQRLKHWAVCTGNQCSSAYPCPSIYFILSSQYLSENDYQKLCSLGCIASNYSRRYQAQQHNLFETTTLQIQKWTKHDKFHIHSCFSTSMDV